MKFKFGFTLSELLMALAIIGIIAALTVPATVNRYQRSTQLAQLKKIYTNLEHNLTLLQSENYRGTFLNSRVGDGSDIEGFFNDYYSVKRKCDNAFTPCFANSYRSIDGTNSGSFPVFNGFAVQLDDDSSIYIETSDQGANVRVDVNGPEPPNIGGRDLFHFVIYDDYSIDEGATPTDKRDGTAQQDRTELFNTNCISSFVGLGCFGKILNDDWKMNY